MSSRTNGDILIYISGIIDIFAFLEIYAINKISRKQIEPDQRNQKENGADEVLSRSGLKSRRFRILNIK